MLGLVRMLGAGVDPQITELNAAKLPNRDVQTLLGQVRASVTPKAAPPGPQPKVYPATVMPPMKPVWL